MSINQVLVRCIYTSARLFLCMVPMAIWGGSAVHNFAVPMLFGIVIATSSSIFIAAPISASAGQLVAAPKEAHQAIEDSAAAQK